MAISIPGLCLDGRSEENTEFLHFRRKQWETTSIELSKKTLHGCILGSPRIMIIPLFKTLKDRDILFILSEDTNTCHSSQTPAEGIYLNRKTREKHATILY